MMPQNSQSTHEVDESTFHGMHWNNSVKQYLPMFSKDIHLFINDEKLI